MKPAKKSVKIYPLHAADISDRDELIHTRVLNSDAELAKIVGCILDPKRKYYDEDKKEFEKIKRSLTNAIAANKVKVIDKDDWVLALGKNLTQTKDRLKKKWQAGISYE